jgi:hypothetical protein
MRLKRFRERCRVEMAKEKERWQRFKQSREQWWYERLGPEEFWRRRLRWLAAKGHHRALARAFDADYRGGKSTNTFGPRQSVPA